MATGPVNGVSVGLTVSGVEFQIKAHSPAAKIAKPTVQQPETYSWSRLKAQPPSIKSVCLATTMLLPVAAWEILLGWDKMCFLQEFLKAFQLLKFTEQETRNVETLIRS